MAGVRIDEIGGDKLERVNAILGRLGNGSDFYRAVGAAMKRATDSGKTQAGRYAAERYAISKGQFMAKTHIGYAISSTNVTISFAGAVIPLIEFGGTSGGPRGGVTAGPKLGGGAINMAFINSVHGKFGVWERVGKSAYPVEQKYGPSTGHMMQDDGVSDKMVKHMEEVFDARIEHEISRILGLF
jgi:hypothetical protein